MANAYVQPLVARYLGGLEQGLRDVGVAAPLQIMLSNGGTCSAETAAEFPVRLVESGPCGGALAAAYWGNREGRADVLAFDMGGTTAKASLSRDGTFPIATESEVARVYRFKRGSGLPLLVPVMDMIEIGAGGGSIAHLNDLGLPAVGPESAGSVPGPACYGSGGRQATVTDADLIIGFLNPDFFLGGEMSLEPGMARRAVSALSEGLGMDPDRMAWGIHRLVNENMANAARIHAAERGVDLRGHTMVATGGAGPVHACGVAERLGISTIVIPPAAGVGSAFGLMLAPISFDTSRTYVSRLDDLDFARLADLYGEMEQSGRAVVRDAGVKARDLCTKRAADLRYVGQGHEIRIEIPKEVLEEAGGGAIRARFEAAYRHVYGRTCEGVPIEAVHWRVRVSGPKPVVGQVHAQSTGGRTEILKGSRQALFDADAGPIEVPVYDRYGLIGGFEADGPAIVEEAESTTVVPPGWRVAVDGSGSLVLVHRGDAG